MNKLACACRLLVLLLICLPAAAQDQDAADSASATPAAAPSEVVSADVDLSSPRATMRTFLEAMGQVMRGADDEAAMDRAIATLDTSMIEPGQAPTAAEQLLDVLDRIETIDLDTLPDAEAAREAGLGRYVYFPRDREQVEYVRQALAEFAMYPRGRIVLERDAAEQWRFSARTVAGMDELARSMQPLPLRHFAPQPEAAPGDGTVVGVIGETFDRTTYLQWFWLLLAIFAGLLAGRIVQAALRRAGDRVDRRGWHARATILHNAASPLSLAFLTLGLYIGLGLIYLEPELASFRDKVIQFLFLIAVGWFAYNLIELIDLALHRVTEKTESKLDDMIVPLVRKTLRIFMVIIFAIVVLQNVFELNITGFLASLGIAGLAVSLAAQDSVKNFFGSLTIFFDKPFAVGDRVVFEGFDGIVEEIGFRSTRIRTLIGHLITVPNMKFIDNSVENIAARPSIRRVVNVTIAYDTPPEKVEEAVRIIKDILAEPDIAEPFDLDNTPPRVYFDAYNPASLNIIVYYWYQLTDGRDWWTYCEHGQMINLKIFQAYKEAGIRFASTQTLFLASDPSRTLDVNMIGSDTSR